MLKSDRFRKDAEIFEELDKYLRQTQGVSEGSLAKMSNYVATSSKMCMRVVIVGIATSRSHRDGMIIRET